MQFKKTKFGKAAFVLVIVLLILFIGYAALAFITSQWLEPLIRIGIIFVVGFVTSIVFLIVSGKEPIPRMILYVITSIILFCSILNTIIDAITNDTGLWYFPLITLPVALIGILVTTFTILALKDRKEEQIEREIS